MLRRFLAAVFFFSITPTFSLHAMSASGLSNEAAMGARALGQYNCITARADDPTALFFNPAGLTQLDGWHLSVNDNILDLQMHYTSPSGQPTNGTGSLINIPSLFIVNGRKDLGLAYGVGVYSEFGLATQWPDNGPLRYSATLSRFDTVTINPTLSLAASPEFQMGVGVDIVDAFDVDLRKKADVSTLNGGAPGTSPDVESRQQATGVGYGFNMGLRYKPAERHTLGISYRSSVYLPLDGTQKIYGLTGNAAALFGGTDYETSAHARITLPASATMGYAYQPTSRWSIETDAQWTDWTSVDSFHVTFDDPDPTRQAVLNQGVDPLNRDWRAVWALGAGTEYTLSDRWTVRGGAGYLWAAVPEGNFDAALPDANRAELTAGVSRRLGRATSIHLAYNAAWFLKRHISNSVAEGTINGSYDMFVNSWSVGVEQGF